MPPALGVALATWLVVLAASRYVSLASVTAAFVLPFAAWLTGEALQMIIIAALVGALAIYKHRSNIQRLLHGTEHRFGTKRGLGPGQSMP
jgi:glycerol-3-phosphate acyltransferase PlsY